MYNNYICIGLNSVCSCPILHNNNQKPKQKHTSRFLIPSMIQNLFKQVFLIIG